MTSTRSDLRSAECSGYGLSAETSSFRNSPSSASTSAKRRRALDGRRGRLVRTRGDRPAESRIKQVDLLVDQSADEPARRPSAELEPDERAPISHVARFLAGRPGARRSGRRGGGGGRGFKITASIPACRSSSAKTQARSSAVPFPITVMSCRFCGMIGSFLPARATMRFAKSNSPTTSGRVGISRPGRCRCAPA